MTENMNTSPQHKGSHSPDFPDTTQQSSQNLDSTLDRDNTNVRIFVMIGVFVLIVIAGIIGYNLLVNAIHADPETFTPQRVEEAANNVLLIGGAVLVTVLVGLGILAAAKVRRHGGK